MSEETRSSVGKMGYSEGVVVRGPTPSEVIAKKYSDHLFGQTRYGSTLFADTLLEALAAAGLRVCSEGQAVVGGEVVNLVQPNDGHKKAVLYRKLNNWWLEKVPFTSKRGTPVYVVEPAPNG